MSQNIIVQNSLDRKPVKGLHFLVGIGGHRVTLPGLFDSQAASLPSTNCPINPLPPQSDFWERKLRQFNVCVPSLCFNSRGVNDLRLSKASATSISKQVGVVTNWMNGQTFQLSSQQERALRPIIDLPMNAFSCFLYHFKIFLQSIESVGDKMAAKEV